MSLNKYQKVDFTSSTVIFYQKLIFDFLNPFQGINGKFWEDDVLRHLGKSVKLKAYSHTIRHVKCSLGSDHVLFRVFCLEKISMNVIYRSFSIWENAIYTSFEIVKMS